MSMEMQASRRRVLSDWGDARHVRNRRNRERMHAPSQTLVEACTSRRGTSRYSFALWNRAERGERGSQSTKCCQHQRSRGIRGLEYRYAVAVTTNPSDARTDPRTLPRPQPSNTFAWTVLHLTAGPSGHQPLGEGTGVEQACTFCLCAFDLQSVSP